jgi:hypothetical protein
MLRTIFLLFSMLLTGGLLTACQPHIPQASVHVDKIVSDVPPDKEIVVAPNGPRKCVHAPATWNNGVWVPAHKVCYYRHMKGHTTWVAGYWHCGVYNTSNTCDDWTWVPAHWSKTTIIY